MAKESGIGWTTCSVDNGATPGVLKAIKNDCKSVTIATPRGVQDITGLDSSGIERLLLLADCSIEISGVFNDAVDMSHDVFKTVSSATTVRSVSLVVSAQTFSAECVFADYPLARSEAGELTWQVTGVNADGAIPAWS